VERLRPSAPDELLNTVERVLVHLYDLRTSSREQIVGLYLNARMKLIHKEILSIGAFNQAVITPKEIFSVIKQLPVMYLVLAHNHPSGDPSPSEEDLAFTKRVAQAADMLGIQLLDHLIVGKTSHYSFKQAGQMKSLLVK
jgi:DNA repair protein RadC